ncbi:cation diffusion facilitator family transporter [Thermocrinis minervae]|uniref:Cobalt-zinc-cadmium efflux system protein n=1 Tax=Thermocrinis minervae TaxID=381751 RepID=A0A1M6Q934_9AQUI|nr:cation diffusion facilitator family transporter [Thermocrinis minervae]SHK16668.1 cobalt-zinc-cadmium efflux system protein [Thermocrinis minervae]
MQVEKSLKLSLLVVLGFAFVELVSGLYTNSLALISDAGHMFTDSFSILVVLFSSLLAKSEANTRRPFGFKRLEVLVTLFNSLMLLFLVGFLVYEGVLRMITPQPIKAEETLAVATLGLLVNLLVGYLLHEHSKSSASIKSAFLHVVFDAIGSLSAIISSLLVLFFSLQVADAVVGFVLSLLILPQVYTIVAESLRILMHFSPKDVPSQKLIQDILKIDGVIDIHSFHLWSIKPQEHVLTVHLVLEDISKAYDAVKNVRKLLEGYGIKELTVQVEPAGKECPSKQEV